MEEIAQVLQVNGISAVPYHAGLDAKTSKTSRHVLNGRCVVVATIAFGMGIDKPDVRFCNSPRYSKIIRKLSRNRSLQVVMVVKGTLFGLLFV